MTADRRPLLLAVLVVTAVAYAVAPDGPAAPWLKPLPALAAAAVVARSGRAGDRIVASGLAVGGLGDVLVELPATERLGTATFVVMVLVVGVGLRSRPARVPLPVALLVAATWASVSASQVVPSLGERRTLGLVVLAATAGFLVVAGSVSPGVLVGALLVATNFTLFAVDLVVTPVPRWLVIGVYDLGLLVLAVALGRDGPAGRRAPPPSTPVDASRG